MKISADTPEISGSGGQKSAANFPLAPSSSGGLSELGQDTDAGPRVTHESDPNAVDVSNPTWGIMETAKGKWETILILLTIVGSVFLLVSPRFDSLEGRIDSVEGRFDSLEGRFDSVEGRFDSVEGRIGSLEGRFDSLEGRFDSLEGRFDSLEGRFDSLEGRFDSLEGRFDSLEAKVDENTLAISTLDSKIDAVDAKFGHQLDKLADMMIVAHTNGSVTEAELAEIWRRMDEE